MHRIHISIGDLTLLADLLDTPTADGIQQALPLEGAVNRWGEEIYFDIPLALPLAADARADVAIGDLAYWPSGPAFCIFFGPTPVSTTGMPRAYSPVNVFGRISGDVEPLKSVRDGETIRVSPVSPTGEIQSIRDAHPSWLAVCLDFKGTLMDHRSGKDLVPGMEDLISALMAREIPLALVSRNPVSAIRDALGARAHWFGDHIYSSGGKGKAECIREFAAQCGIHDLERIAFVDDKPDNLLPVASGTAVRVIGFHGSGKYPQTPEVCRHKGIPFARTAAELGQILDCPL